MMCRTELNEEQISQFLALLQNNQIYESVDGCTEVWVNSDHINLSLNFKLNKYSDYYKELNQGMGRTYCEACNCWVFKFDKHLKRLKHQKNTMPKPNDE